MKQKLQNLAENLKSGLNQKFLKTRKRLLGKLKKQQENYVKKDEYATLYQQQRAGEKILETAQNLAKEIDGTDGRPAFEIDSILEFMRENNIADPNLAYRIKNEEALDAWKESKYAEAKKPGLNTLEVSTAGSKQPRKVKATKDWCHKHLKVKFNIDSK